jgi:hypothetical protein
VGLLIVLAVVIPIGYNLLPTSQGRPQIVLLVLLVALPLLRWYRNSGSQDGSLARGRWWSPAVTLAVVAVLLTTNYVLAYSTQWLRQVTTTQLLISGVLVVIGVILTGTDYAEIGEVIGQSVSRVASHYLAHRAYQRVVPVLAALNVTLGAVQLTSGWAIRPFIVNLIVAVPAGVSVVGLMAALARLWTRGWVALNPDLINRQPAKVPLRGPVVAATVWLAFQVLAVVVTLSRSPEAAATALQAAAGGAVGLLGLVWLWRGRRGGRTATAGIYLMVVLAGALYDILLATLLGATGSTVRAVGPDSSLMAEPLLVIHHAQIVVGVLALGLMLGQRLAIGHRQMRVLEELPELLIAFLILGFIAQALSIASSFGERYVILLSVLLVGALTWDFLMSGEAITNRDGRRFSRTPRVLFYGGCTILVAAVVVLVSNLRMNHQEAAALSTIAFDSEAFALAGLVFLGIPLLVVNWLFRITTSRVGSSALGPRRGPVLWLEDGDRLTPGAGHSDQDVHETFDSKQLAKLDALIRRGRDGNYLALSNLLRWHTAALGACPRGTLRRT